MIQLPNLLLSIYNQAREAVRVRQEEDNHDSPLPEMNRELLILAKTNASRVKEAEKDVKGLTMCKEAAF